MANVKYRDPIATVKGKLGKAHNGVVDVQRKKIFGYDTKGRPITGPQESYYYHLHEGKWSEPAMRNRQLFQQATSIAQQEMADPVLAEQWQTAFQAQLENPLNGKRYVKYQTFVIAQIHKRLKNTSTSHDQ